LEAYLRLSEAVSDLSLVILPGVEWLSREGIEAIFIYPDEAALIRGLKEARPFSHSIWDFGALAKGNGAISIIPHPFTLGKTGAANHLGTIGLINLLREADYVEIFNGLSYQMAEFQPFLTILRLFPEYRKRLAFTENLPSEFRLDGLGWSVGSDAHFPGEGQVVGKIVGEWPQGWFKALSERVRFQPERISPALPRAGRRRRNLSSLATVTKEAFLKGRERRRLFSATKASWLG
jgi:hypothetical protein